MQMTDSNPDAVEALDDEQVEAMRKIARQEASEIAGIEVEDQSGKRWSLSSLVEKFDISRRTALKSMGLMAVGASASGAVLEVLTGNAKASTGSAGQVGTSKDRPDIYGDSADFSSVSTGTAETDNQTFAILTRGTDSASTGSGTFTNAYDGESKDQRGEVASAEITPDTSGEYTFLCSVKFGGSTTAGDLLRARVYDVTNSTGLGPEDQRSVQTSVPDVNFVFGATLVAGNTYRVEVTNQDTSFIVQSSSAEGRVLKGVVQ